MRGIILAAGRGSRLRHLTDDKPKCLVPFHGRPLLERQIDALKKGGAGEITIVGGYRHDCLTHYGFPVLYNGRWESTNMVVSLLCADALLSSQPAIVSYSDIFYSHSLVDRLVNASGNIIIAQDENWRWLWEKRFDDPLKDAETFNADNNGRVLEIGNRANNIDDIKGQFMGVFKIAPDGWKAIRRYIDSCSPAELSKLDMTRLLSKLIQSGEHVSSIPCVGDWGEIDQESDIHLYERLFPCA
jgi:L-glutamine-phosphate cytidylyltransferase